jgi:macrolide-specific efflux system membrane fusion protein
MFTRKKIIWATIIVASAFSLWYFFGRGPKVVYDSYSVTRQNINDTLELSGKVTAENSATLRFLAGGLVTYVGAHEGDTVKKWQTLASLDTRQLQNTLTEKLNLYAIQRGTFDQTIADNSYSVPGGDLGNTLKRLLAKNQYQLDNTVKDVEYQDLSLQLSRLVSPIAGVLIQSPTSVGGVQVMPTDSWMVVDPSSLYLSADLDETDLRRVTVGQKVIVTLDAFPDHPINSTVKSIAFSPKETTTGTTYEVKVGLNPSDFPGLRLGLNGTAAVVLSEKDNALTLPASAITTTGSNSYVYILSGKKYVQEPIQTGIENGGVVEILGGVSEGDHVYAKK